MNLVYIDQVAIPINSDWTDVAVSVSGGADSALLAYFVCLYAAPTTTIHIINHIRCWKTKPWQEHDAEQVYFWLLKRFSSLKFKRHVNFIAPELEYANIGPALTDEYGKKVSGDNIQQRAYAEYICNKHNIAAYYNAVTRNPRDLAINGMTERDIEKNGGNIHLEIMKHMDRWALHPFRFVEKSWVVKQYRAHNLMELFNITRSCEGEVDGLNYTNYKPGQEVPTCGECFWCKERAWAIEQSK